MNKIRWLWKSNSVQYLKDFEHSKWQPLRVQEKILLRILKKEEKTKYGREHNFKEIKSIQDFQKKISLQEYDDIIGYIEEMKNGKTNILCSEKVEFFATSSGTTSKQKFIPITKERRKLFKRELLLWTKTILSKELTGVQKGKTLYFAAASHLGKTKARIPYGNITGYHVKHLPWYIKRKMIIPYQYYNIKDVEVRSKLIARKALLEKNITQLAFAAPIEILLFLDYIEENKKELVEYVKEKKKKRGEELKQLLKKNKFKPQHIWPKIKLISCITADINTQHLEQLYKKLGKKILTREPGIYASEGRINIGITKRKDAGVLVANTNFFEFEEYDKEKQKFKKPILINKIKKGKLYRVRITTPEGLYRYNLGDIIKVVGFKRKLPIVKYYDRDKYINIVGENLSTQTIIKAMKKTIKKTETENNIENYIVGPVIPKKGKPHYEILIAKKGNIKKEKLKTFIKIFDEELQKLGKTYSKARNEFGRLNKAQLSIVENKDFKRKNKQLIEKTGQAKPQQITKNPEFKKEFTIQETIK